MSTFRCFQSHRSYRSCNGLSMVVLMNNNLSKISTTSPRLHNLSTIQSETSLIRNQRMIFAPLSVELTHYQNRNQQQQQQQQQQQKSFFSSTSVVASEESSVNNNQQVQQQQQQQENNHVFNSDLIIKAPPAAASSKNKKEKRKTVPDYINRPSYAVNGYVSHSIWTEQIMLHDTDSSNVMRQSANLAASVLLLACDSVQVGRTTNEIDNIVHNAILQANAYPSPLGYLNFPKSVCTSINNIVCHGIPDNRPIQYGDLVKIDVSCYLNGVHGDNCASVIAGDNNNNGTISQNNDNNNNKPATIYSSPTYDTYKNLQKNNVDWRNIEYKTNFTSQEEEDHFILCRRLINVTREALYAGIDECYPNNCLSKIGCVIDNIAQLHNFASIKKYRGHGISHIFHTAPFVKHFNNNDSCTLQPGMIFTIEPMLVNHPSNDTVYEWTCDKWTVSTINHELTAQFEHTVLITDTGVEILTVPSQHFIDIITK